MQPRDSGTNCDGTESKVGCIYRPSPFGMDSDSGLSAT